MSIYIIGIYTIWFTPIVFVVVLALFLISSYENFDGIFRAFDNVLGIIMKSILLFDGYSLIPLVQVLVGYVSITCLARENTTEFLVSE